MKFIKKITAAATALFLTGIVVNHSVAFKPDKHRFGHTMIVESILLYGYSLGSGIKIDKWSTKLSDGSVVNFSIRAANDVALGVRAVDYDGFLFHMMMK